MEPLILVRDQLLAVTLADEGIGSAIKTDATKSISQAIAYLAVQYPYAVMAGMFVLACLGIGGYFWVKYLLGREKVTQTHESMALMNRFLDHLDRVESRHNLPPPTGQVVVSQVNSGARQLSTPRRSHRSKK